MHWSGQSLRSQYKKRYFKKLCSHKLQFQVLTLWMSAALLLSCCLGAALTHGHSAVLCHRDRSEKLFSELRQPKRSSLLNSSCLKLNFRWKKLSTWTVWIDPCPVLWLSFSVYWICFYNKLCCCTMCWSLKKSNYQSRIKKLIKAVNIPAFMTARWLLWAPLYDWFVSSLILWLTLNESQ